MLASFESCGMISVWQMESMSLAQDAAGDFYSSSAEKNPVIALPALFSSHQKVMGQSVVTDLCRGQSNFAEAGKI